jgi:hypothetical protein
LERNIKTFLTQEYRTNGCIQFNDYNEAVSSYTRLKDLGYTHIAFNHGSNGYLKMFPHKNKLVSQMMGRILLINKMLESMGLYGKQVIIIY